MFLNAIIGAIIFFLTYRAILFYKFMVNLREIWKAAAQFPGGKDTGHWLLGSIHRTRKIGMPAMMLEMRERAKKGMRVYVTWKSPFLPIFTLLHPDTAKVVLKRAEPKGHNWNGIYGIMSNWIGMGLVTSSGPKWERNRRLLTPAFHFNILKSYFAVYNESAKKLLANIEEEGKTNDYVDTMNLCKLHGLDVILKCSFSFTGDIQTDRSHPYPKGVNRLTHLVFHRVLSAGPEWFYKLTAQGREFYGLVNYLHDFVDKVIENRRASLMNDENASIQKKYRDFLDILLSARDTDGNGLSHKDIVSEVDTFLTAGYETTATLLAYCCYELATHPDIQEKIYNEVQSKVADTENVTPEEILELRYTAMFIQEVLRIHPPITAIARDLSQPMEIDGVILPASSRVVIGIQYIHCNTDFWKDPDEFRPDRFDEESWKGSTRHPYMFVPFSVGPRNCIGQNFAIQETKATLSHIVSRFKLSKPADHKLVIYSAVTSRSQSGVPIKFTMRE